MKTKEMKFRFNGGVMLAQKWGEGILAEFDPKDGKERVTLPTVVMCTSPEDGKLYAYVWADPNDEDYTHKIELKY